MDNNILTILVIVLICTILVLIAVLAYFGHRFLKLRELEAKNIKPHTFAGDQLKNEESSPEFASKKQKKSNSELLTSLRSSNKDFEKSLYCVDHPEELAQGTCAISGEAYCVHCLVKQEDIKVARKNLDLYLDNEWEQVKMIYNDGKNIDLKIQINSIKEELWSTESLPIIIQEHFKINVEDDEIEEFTVILSRVEDKDYISKELSFIK